MIPVKICGITSLGDGLLATEMGASALGFIFYEKSPRYISPEQAKVISAELPEDVRKVGVFVNSGEDTIDQISKFIGLDFVQFHGYETPEFCNRATLPVIKAIRIRGNQSSESYANFNVHAFLFDTYDPHLEGGTGSTFDWSLVKQWKTETPFILSGGLNPDNILDGIAAAKPDAVDVNSGVETSPGKKDEAKLRALFEVLKTTNTYQNVFEFPLSQSRA